MKDKEISEGVFQVSFRGKPSFKDHKKYNGEKGG